MKLIAFTLLFYISFTSLYSQKLPSIQLDRPDQTECPYITPTKYIQVENGFTFERISNLQKVNYYPTSLWKYGVNKNFELRLITELTSIVNNTSKTTGINPITMGFKTKLLEEKGIVPLTSFIGHFTTAGIGSKALRTNFSSPSFRFLMQHTLSDKAVLAYNLGAEWNSNSPEATYIYTLTTGITLTQKLGCYFELFGSLPETLKAIHQFDGGITYLVNDDFIFDLSSGVGLSKNAAQNYISLGISFRFNTAKNNVVK